MELRISILIAIIGLTGMVITAVISGFFVLLNSQIEKEGKIAMPWVRIGLSVAISTALCLIVGLIVAVFVWPDATVYVSATEPTSVNTPTPMATSLPPNVSVAPVSQVAAAAAVKSGSVRNPSMPTASPRAVATPILLPTIDLSPPSSQSVTGAQGPTGPGEKGVQVRAKPPLAPAPSISTDDLPANLLTCSTANASIHAYRLTPEQTWYPFGKINGSVRSDGKIKIDGLPVDRYRFGGKGEPYRFEIWVGDQLVRSIGDYQKGERIFRLYPEQDNEWGC